MIMERPHYYNIGDNGIVVSRSDTIDSVNYHCYIIENHDRADLICCNNPHEFLSGVLSIIGERYRAELKWWLYL